MKNQGFYLKKKHAFNFCLVLLNIKKLSKEFHYSLYSHLFKNKKGYVVNSTSRYLQKICRWKNHGEKWYIFLLTMDCFVENNFLSCFF